MRCIRQFSEVVIADRNEQDLWEQGQLVNAIKN